MQDECWGGAVVIHGRPRVDAFLADVLGTGSEDLAPLGQGTES
jgi:hypothetical protein